MQVVRTAGMDVWIEVPHTRTILPIIVTAIPG